MKKILESMLAIFVAAFTLTSCEDVPAPYEIPSDGGDDDNPSTVVEPTGDGTLANPFNSVAANNKAAELEDKGTSTEKYYVKGKVVSIRYNYGEGSYTGTADYYISDDGTTNGQFYVYASKYLGDVSYTSGTVLQVGDEVIIYGNLYNYGGTYETATNKSYLYSLNGQTAGGGNDEPSGDVLKPTNGVFINETFASDFGVFTAKTVKGLSWIIDYSTAKATGYDNSAKTTTPSEAYLVSKPMDMSSTTAATVTFEYILRYYTNYGEAKAGVADKVLITDNYTDDPSTTTWTDITGTLTEGSDWNTFSSFSASVPAAFLGKSKVVIALYYACNDNSATWEVKNLKVSEGQSGGGTSGGETSGNTITVDVNSFGLENQTALTTLTLTDGTTLTFNAGSNSNGPKYYTTGGGTIRMYPNNSVTIASTKAVSSVKIVCDEYNGTTYNASGDISASNGTVKVDGVNVSVTGISNSSVTITDTSSTTGGNSQIRIKTLEISYAD